MGREVRRVPASWQHPTDHTARGPVYRPLWSGSFSHEKTEWEEQKAAWERGEYPDNLREEYRTLTWEEWCEAGAPNPDDYMPDWKPEECTHLQMYENCTEGTPISPVMDSPESLARWLVDNRASAFGSETATYEQWLRVCRGGWAPSAVMGSTGDLRSSVAAITAAASDESKR